MASVPVTPPSTKPLDIKVVAQVGTSAFPPTTDLTDQGHQQVVEVEDEVLAIYLYMLMFGRLVTVKDFVLVNPEVDFALGTSIALPEDQWVIQSITAVNELQTKGF